MLQRTSTDLMVQLIPDYFSQGRISIPKTQRGQVWTVEQKQGLIDSLYNNFDIPKVYFRSEKGGTLWSLIDGQQRLTAIREFVENKFPLAKETTTIPIQVRGKFYRELTPEDKGNITARSITAVIFQTDDESEEEDMFLRLNNGTPLNAAEKRNAIRGEFREAVKEIAKHRFFKNKVYFKDSRFAFDSIASQLISISLNDGPTSLKGTMLRKLYEDKRVFPEKEVILGEVKKILNILDKIFPEKEALLKKFYVVSLFAAIRQIEKEFGFRQVGERGMGKFVLDFEHERSLNSERTEEEGGFKPELFDFYEKSVNSPDSEDSVRTRHAILMRYILEAFPNLKPKDDKRLFSEDQKFAIYYLQGGKCKTVKGYLCPTLGKKIPISEGDFDHISEHSSGGKTSVINGQFLCKLCHIQKTSMYKKTKGK
jgi:hypothetical protein